MPFTGGNAQQQPRPNYSDNNGAVFMGNHVNSSSSNSSSNRSAASPQERPNLVYRGVSGLPPPMPPGASGPTGEALVDGIGPGGGSSRVSSPRNPMLGNIPHVNSGEKSFLQCGKIYFIISILLLHAQ